MMYIMAPAMFESLKEISGFVDANGNTYIEHICIIFNSELTVEQKQHIKTKKNAKEALNYLKTIINYTH